MDQQSKLKKLLDILTEWLTYSKLYSKVDVELVTRSNRLAATYREFEEYGERRKEMVSIQDEKIPTTEYIRVVYSRPKVDWRGENGFESIEFPLTDLDARLEHYRNKLRNIKEKLQVTE